MASGWANDNAVNDQIRASLEDEAERVRRRLPQGQGLVNCEECGEEIPEARRQALPGVRLCLACQTERDEEEARERSFSPYNRRGSKDSQLR